ncbi:MAG: hypothetical protein N0E54_10655 [Candidatus Thiodiazotropha taylori]|nr:hypothetical protein [Candidatus Thiodiazotropha endolucinida]MCW4229188.1 hypothetical protein [Candidatus Thiodiazotropha taylori]
MTSRAILWVDDDINTSLRPYIDELEDAGFNVLQAENLERMKNVLESSDDLVSLIILDVMMPTGQSISLKESHGGQFTGLVVAKELLSIVQYKEIPILLFTLMDVSGELDVDPRIKIAMKQETLPSDLCDLVKKIIGS